jgi:hypothetical protein
MTMESAMADIYFNDAIFVAQPSDIDTIWTSDDSLLSVTDLLKNHFDEIEEKKGVDLQDYNESENRYEANELAFIGKYIINNLIFLK